MSIQVIEAEAQSLEEARRILKSSLPEGFEIFSEQVISDEFPKTKQGTGITLEAAFAEAQKSIPKGAEIIERREITSPIVKTIPVYANTEQQARIQVEQKPDETISIDAIKLIKQGNVGFLGIGKQPNQYQISVIQHGTVEIVYRATAKVIMRCGLPRDLIFALAEGSAGGWPTELPDNTFDQIDLDQLAACLKHYQEMPHPGILSRVLPTYPSYSIVNGKIVRKSNPALDAQLLQTAAFMSSIGTFNPLDPSNARLAMQIIERYAQTTLARFLFSLPRYYDLCKTSKQARSLVIEDLLIDIYKGVENTLFEIYDDLHEGQVFTDETVTQKLLSLVYAKDRRY